MHDKDVIEDKEGLTLPAVYAIATSTEFNLDKQQITAQDIINEQVKGLYCRQATYTVSLRGPCIIMEGMDFGRESRPSKGQFK